MTCEECQDLLPLYLTGSLTPSEQEAVRGHVAGCGACVQALREMEETLHTLPAGLAPLAAPAGAWEKIETRMALAGEMAAEAAERRAGADRGALEQPLVRRRINWAGITGWAAAAVVTVVLGLRLQSQLGEMERMRGELAAARTLGAEVEPLKARLTALEGQLNDVQTNLKTQLASNEAQRGQMERLMLSDAYALKGAEQPAVHGKVFWDAKEGLLTVMATQVAPCAPGKTYQLWGIMPSGEKIPMVTGEPDASGRLVLEMKVPETARGMTVAAVTDEPTGGLPQPSGKPQFLGTLARQ